MSEARVMIHDHVAEIIPAKFGVVREMDGNIIRLTPQTEPKSIKLRKDGKPKNVVNNKKKGRKSEVYAFTVQDMKRMVEYLKDRQMWPHYLLFVFGCNMARRVGDTLALTWEHIYDPKTGRMRNDLLEIEEDKTDKLANPRINSACRAAIELYLKEVGCDPALEGYTKPVFLQYSGTYKGRVLTDDGYRKAIKKAAVALGIEYNVGTHSPRKTFGMTSRMLHPGDYDSMELLQTIYNHSDTKTTKHYIGLTKKKVDAYYDDMGSFFDEYVTGDKEYIASSDSPIVSMDSNDLMDVIKAAYQAGRDNASNTDAMIHVDAITTIMSMIEQLSK